MCLLDFEDQVDVGLSVFGRCTSTIKMTTSSDRPDELPDTTLIWFLFPAPLGIHCYVMLRISIIFRTLRDEEPKFIP
jgi:hypothetical protein